MIAAVLAMGCGGSQPGGLAGIVSSPQAGGETAWVRRLDAGRTALAVAPLADGRVAVAAGTGDGAAVQLEALDSSGAVSWSRSIAASCPVSLEPLGAIASAASIALASAPCSPVVTGLGPEPVPANGALVLLDARGAPAGRLEVGADLAGAEIAAAVVTSTGEVAILARAASPTVVLVGADAVERWRREAPGAELLSSAPSGDVVVASTGTGAELARIRHDGAPAWSRALPAAFSLRGMAVLTDGAVAVLGTISGPIAWGRGAASGGDGTDRAVLVVEPDGTERTVAGVTATVGMVAGPHVAALPHGRILLYGAEGCDRLRALSPQLEPVWDRALDPACAATVSSIAVSGAGQIVVGGSVDGTAEFGSGYVLDAPVGSGTPFALALWP